MKAKESEKEHPLQNSICEHNKKGANFVMTNKTYIMGKRQKYLFTFQQHDCCFISAIDFINKSNSLVAGVSALQPKSCGFQPRLSHTLRC